VVDAKLTESCAECHGDRGISTAQDVPTIGGISATFHGDALKAYRAKTAPYPKLNYKRGDISRQGDMCSVTKDLNDAQVADLADYYAKLQYAAQKQPFDAGKAAAREQ
jgi:cytochrome c553